MIVFMRDQVIPGPKLLDVEVTNTFPIISLTNETYLLDSSQEKELLMGYDHIAIPPDFRLHISGPKEHLFFDATPIWNLLNLRRIPRRSCGADECGVAYCYDRSIWPTVELHTLSTS